MIRNIVKKNVFICLVIAIIFVLSLYQYCENNPERCFYLEQDSSRTPLAANYLQKNTSNILSGHVKWLPKETTTQQPIDTLKDLLKKDGRFKGKPIKSTKSPDSELDRFERVDMEEVQDEEKEREEAKILGLDKDFDNKSLGYREEDFVKREFGEEQELVRSQRRNWHEVLSPRSSLARYERVDKTIIDPGSMTKMDLQEYYNKTINSSSIFMLTVNDVNKVNYTGSNSFQVGKNVSGTNELHQSRQATGNRDRGNGTVASKDQSQKHYSVNSKNRSFNRSNAVVSGKAGNHSSWGNTSLNKTNTDVERKRNKIEENMNSEQNLIETKSSMEKANYSRHENIKNKSMLDNVMENDTNGFLENKREGMSGNDAVNELEVVEEDEGSGKNKEVGNQMENKDGNNEEVEETMGSENIGEEIEYDAFGKNLTNNVGTNNVGKDVSKEEVHKMDVEKGNDEKDAYESEAEKLHSTYEKTSNVSENATLKGYGIGNGRKREEVVVRGGEKEDEGIASMRASDNENEDGRTRYEMAEEKGGKKEDEISEQNYNVIESNNVLNENATKALDKTDQFEEIEADGLEQEKIFPGNGTNTELTIRKREDMNLEERKFDNMNTSSPKQQREEAAVQKNELKIELTRLPSNMKRKKSSKRKKKKLKKSMMYFKEVSCEPLDPKLLLFNRIFKTGSTSLNKYLLDEWQRNYFHIKIGTTEDWYKTGDSYPYPNVIEEYASRSLRRRVYSGHFYFRDKLRIKRPYTYINQVREPLQRIISHYHYMRQSTDRPKQRIREMIETGEYNETLTQCFERQHRGCENNVMTRFFCGEEEFCKTGAASAVQRAKYNMKHYFAAIGLTESLDLYLEVLKKRLPKYFRLSAALRREKTGKYKRYLKSVSEEIKERIKKANAADYEIYNYAKMLFNKQLKACGISRKT